MVLSKHYNQDIKSSKLKASLSFLVLSLSLILLINGVSALSSTATVDFDSEVGQIRSDFYGVNAHGYYFGSGGNLIDANNDGVKETVLNYTWHREKFLESNMKIYRIDLNLESNSLSYGVYKSDLYNLKGKELEWALQNNKTVSVTLSSMPNWLANKTSGFCTLNGLNESCPPINYHNYSLMIEGALLNLTNNHQLDSAIRYVNVWNEAWGGSWMNNVTYGNSIREIEFNKLYNATYSAIKRYNSSILVSADVQLSANYKINFTISLLANQTNKIEYLNIHPYIGDNNPQTLMNYLSYFILNATKYGVSTNNIILEEWNYQNATLQNSSIYSTQYSNLLSSVYSSLLNSYPANITSLFYQWSERFKYGSYFPDYPAKWSMVSEPLLDNAYYPPYNITKLFANNHKALNYVVTSSTDDSTIKIVASKDAQGTKYITLTNTNTSSFDVILNGVTTDYIDVQTGERYNLNDGSNSITINGLTSYEVLTLRSSSTVGLGSTCDASTISFYQIILDLAALALIAIVFYLIFKDGWEDITLQKILMAGIALIVGIILFQTSADNLAIGACP
jgi:hypothetical protein